MVIVCDGPINLFLSALYKAHDYLNKRPSARGRRLCALVLGTGFRVKSPAHITIADVRLVDIARCATPALWIGFLPH